MEYKHATHHIYLLNYHLIWCPKRRRPVLVGKVKDRLKQLLDSFNFSSTAGNVSNETIKKYIEAQSKK